VSRFEQQGHPTKNIKGKVLPVDLPLHEDI
jgi:hypothetical protein